MLAPRHAVIKDKSANDRRFLEKEALFIGHFLVTRFQILLANII